MSKQTINLSVNGQSVTAEAEPRELLIHVLREQLEITGPHIGCETSHCGACTCLLYTSPSPRDATLSRMPSSA